MRTRTLQAIISILLLISIVFAFSACNGKLTKMKLLYSRKFLETANYAVCARNYLVSIGMAEADINALVSCLVK